MEAEIIKKIVINERIMQKYQEYDYEKIKLHESRYMEGVRQKKASARSKTEDGLASSRLK